MAAIPLFHRFIRPKRFLATDARQHLSFVPFLLYAGSEAVTNFLRLRRLPPLKDLVGCYQKPARKILTRRFAVPLSVSVSQS